MAEYFFGSYYVELFRKLKISRLISENFHYLNNHRSLNAIKYFIFYLLPDNIQTIVNNARFSSVDKNFINKNKTDSSLDSMLYSPKSLQKSLVQHFEYKLEHLLRWEDLNAMHFSIESRVPFLDYRLVESTISLPSEKIINKGVTKYILRKAMKDILPQRIYERKDKKGFSSPREKWFRSNNFSELIQNIIHSDKFKNRGYFTPKIATNRYKLHLDGKIDISKEIWKWINLELWFRKFID